MSVQWFRRPDGVLVAARADAQLDRFIGRGYEGVSTEDAEREVKSGKQAELNASRAETDKQARERQLAIERQRKAQRRQAQARAAEEAAREEAAKLEVTPPAPPEADKAAVDQALAEHGKTPGK